MRHACLLAKTKLNALRWTSASLCPIFIAFSIGFSSRACVSASTARAALGLGDTQHTTGGGINYHGRPSPLGSTRFRATQTGLRLMGAGGGSLSALVGGGNLGTSWDIWVNLRKLGEYLEKSTSSSSRAC
eukprot:GEMP01068443.1.p1 GENE.GEMP01068443.1~~GEMP01068443.1.p1  ORF type:complete len:130 (-),score=0.46 GEMP01068443.1:95-484(-)